MDVLFAFVQYKDICRTFEKPPGHYTEGDIYHRKIQRIVPVGRECVDAAVVGQHPQEQPQAVEKHHCFYGIVIPQAGWTDAGNDKAADGLGEAQGKIHRELHLLELRDIRQHLLAGNSICRGCIGCRQM
ncbi:hypothetical protein [Dawidia soli]|uniref:Uncharacterized protein n=1 Tax=Dawidia soli TaxID=2782352 RepID=A0AAP2DJ72_9BACT|nr:hypothetical protein [Dawidia soli]MBT1690432.1 hypothetical protein [Dawidia soli]